MACAGKYARVTLTFIIGGGYFDWGITLQDCTPMQDDDVDLLIAFATSFARRFGYTNGEVTVEKVSIYRDDSSYSDESSESWQATA